jgi:hypothetical protein
MSDFRYEIKTSLPVIWLEILTQKFGLVRTQRTKLILVDLVEDEEAPGPRTRLSSTLTIRSKERKEYYSLILIESIITLHKLWQIFQCDHRLTSVCQLDLQEASKLTLKFSSLCCRNIFRKLKFKFRKSIASILSKVNKYFLKK